MEDLFKPNSNYKERLMKIIKIRILHYVGYFILKRIIRTGGKVKRKKEIIEINIDKVIFPNKGIGNYNGRKVVVKGGIEGQQVRVLVKRKRKSHIDGNILGVVERAPIEKEAKCPHFKECGGCYYQTLSYEDELKIKTEGVKDLFDSSNIEMGEFLGIEESPQIKGYKNKMEYTFGDAFKDGDLVLGLHKRGRFYEISEVENCTIADKDFTTILQETSKYFREMNIPHYKKKNHIGVLRHLAIRKALSTGEILVNLVTSSQQELELNGFAEKLKNIKLDGHIVGFLHTTNDRVSDSIIPEKVEIIYGRDYITEELLGYKFKISPFSFFQTNTFGAERLYTTAREFAGDLRDKTIFDLYCGTGTISIIMSSSAKKVVGIEIEEEAVEMAKENLMLNEINNTEFICGDVLNQVDNLNERPNLIIIDPPRQGIHPKAINKIIDFNPEEFIYISCNPVTLVRDLRIFEDRNYRVKKVKIIDMFPRAGHVEAAILMTYCGLDKK